MADSELDAVARARLGRVLRGKYRLDRVLGVGGMAVVYAATHRNKKRFAIKMLHPELSMREAIRTRFVREGYVANSVEHPGAVAVLDDDVAEDGSAFVVMELLEGATVDEVRAKHGGRAPVGLVVSMVDALLDVLAAAHAKGIVHRDVKPANLFLTCDGRLAVLDFGIARLHDSASGEATATGMMLGTPAYMAPEQALGKTSEIDATTDLWAVGATAFALLTGQLVHEGENSAQLLIAAGTKRARPLRSVNADVPEAVAKVVDKALAFDKAARWPGAAAMREALAKACVEATGAPVAPLPKSERVTGLEATIASSADVAPGSSGVGFEPTVDAPGERSAPKELPAQTSAAIAQTKPSIPAPDPARARSPRWPLALAAALIVVAAASGAVMMSAGRKKGAEAAVAASASPPAASSSAPRPGRPPATPVAAAAYEAALQAQRDGNEPEVERNLTAAVAADPALGAAHLRLAFYWAAADGDHETQARAEYQLAREHRATLGEVDAAVLDASEPRFRDPPDRGERNKRLGVVAARYPGDAALQTFYAECLEGANRTDEIPAILDRALAADPKYVPALVLRMRRARADGDDDAAKRVIDACLEGTPGAVTCLEARMEMAFEEGRCADAKANARSVLAVDPSSSDGYRTMAWAMFALGEPIDAVREALHRADAQVLDADRRHVAELETAAAIALQQGDLAAADKALGDGFAFASTRPLLDAAGTALWDLEVALEEGRTARVRELVAALRTRFAASAGGEIDLANQARVAYAAVQAGASTRAQLEAERQRLLAASRDDDARRAVAKQRPFQKWLMIYAVGAHDEQDAVDAVTALPQFGGLDDPLVRFPESGAMLGRVLAFGGRPADAIPILQRRIGSCWEMADEMEQVRALYALGFAREKTGDVAGARDAYQRVLARWGHAKPRSVTADTARARLAGLPKN